MLRFVHGPIFAQIILADEINRTPPKTQAALLEAMQEYHVTAAGRTYELDRPFFVLATQNPIELEGTYPLPEAQLDRFLFNVVMTYLSEDDEVKVVTETTEHGPTGAGARARRRRHPAHPGLRPAGVDRRRGRALRGAAHRQFAARPRRQARFRPEVGQVGGGAPRLARPGPRGQGAGADPRAAARGRQGHPGAGQADPASPRSSPTSTPRPRASTPSGSSSSCSRPCRCPRAGCDGHGRASAVTWIRRSSPGWARST